MALSQHIDPLLTAKQVQTVLGVSHATFYRWKSVEGFPKAIRIGANSVRYRQSDVLAFINDRVEG